MKVREKWYFRLWYNGNKFHLLGVIWTHDFLTRLKLTQNELTLCCQCVFYAMSWHADVASSNLVLHYSYPCYKWYRNTLIRTRVHANTRRRQDRTQWLALNFCFFFFQESFNWIDCFAVLASCLQVRIISHFFLLRRGLVAVWPLGACNSFGLKQLAILVWVALPQCEVAYLVCSVGESPSFCFSFVNSSVHLWRITSLQIFCTNLMIKTIKFPTKCWNH